MSMNSSEDKASPSPSESPTPPESAVSPSSDVPNQNSEVVSSEQASNDFNELFVLIESFIGILDPRTICEVAYEYAESITPPDADFSDFKANYMSAVMLPLMLFSFIAACSHSEMFQVMSSKQIEEIKKGGRKRQSGGGKNGQPFLGGPFRGPTSRTYMNYLRKLGKDNNPMPKRNGRDVSSFDPGMQFYNSTNFPQVNGDEKDVEEGVEEDVEKEEVVEEVRRADEGDVDVEQVEQGSQTTLPAAARMVGNRRLKTRPIRSPPKLDTKKWLAWTLIFMICFAPIAGAKTQQDLPGKYHKIPLRNPELDIARQMIANSAAGSFIANAGGALHLTTNTLIHAIGSNSQAAYALNYVQQLPAGTTIASTLAPLVGATKITPQTNLPVNVVLNRNPADIERGVTVTNAKSGTDNIPVQYISGIEQQAMRLAKLNSFCGQRKGEINVDRTKCNSEYFNSVHQRLYLAFSSFPGLVREQYDQYMASSQKSCGADMKVTRKVFVPEVPAVAAGRWTPAEPAKPAHYTEETVPCINVPRHLFHVRNDPNDGAIEFYIPEESTLDAVRMQLRDTMPKECPRVEYSIINGNQKDFDLNIEKWVVDFVTNKELRKTIDLIKDPELKKSTLKDLFNKCLIWQLTLDVTSDEYFQLVKELSASVDIDIQLPSDVPKALIVENSPVALYMAQYKSFEYLKIMSQAEIDQQEKDNARIKEDRGKDNYVAPPDVERLTVDKIMNIYEEYKKSETYAARFAAGVLGPTLRGIGEILEKTLDEASRAAARSAGKIVKNVGEELGMGNLFGGLAIFGFWSTLAGVGVPAAGIFGSFGYVAWWVFMKTMGKNRARISAAGSAGGCIRRNAGSGGGTKRKKIKTKIVKSKKRRLNYFTRRRSIIKKIRRSKKN